MFVVSLISVEHSSSVRTLPRMRSFACHFCVRSFRPRGCRLQPVTHFASRRLLVSSHIYYSSGAPQSLRRILRNPSPRKWAARSVEEAYVECRSIGVFTGEGVGERQSCRKTVNVVALSVGKPSFHCTTKRSGYGTTLLCTSVHTQPDYLPLPCSGLSTMRTCTPPCLHKRIPPPPHSRHTITS
jgi:hypothetical protein